MAFRYRVAPPPTQVPREIKHVAPAVRPTRRYEQLQVYISPGDVRPITPADYTSYGIQNSAVNPFTDRPWIKGEREYVDYQAGCYNSFPEHIYDDPRARRELLYEWAASLLVFPLAAPFTPFAYLRPEQVQQIEHEARCFLELSDFTPFLHLDWDRATAEQYLLMQPPGAFLFRSSSVRVDDPDIKMYVLSFRVTEASSAAAWSRLSEPEKKQQMTITNQLFALHPNLGIVTFEDLPPQNLMPGDTHWDTLQKRHFNSVVELMEDTLPNGDPSGKAWIEYLFSMLESALPRSPCVSVNRRVDCSECRAEDGAPESRRCAAQCLVRGVPVRCNRFALPFERYCLQHLQEERARREAAERAQREAAERAERQATEEKRQRARYNVPTRPIEQKRPSYRIPSRPAAAAALTPAVVPGVLAVPGVGVVPAVPQAIPQQIAVPALPTVPEAAAVADRKFEAPEGTALKGTMTEVMDEAKKKRILQSKMEDLPKGGGIEQYIAGTSPDVYVRVFYGTQRNPRHGRPLYIQVYRNGQPTPSLLAVRTYEWSTSVSNVTPPVPLNFP